MPDVETATNEISRLFFWHKGGLLENDYRADKRCLTTNIIFVQLESYFDPTEVEWLRFSEDPIPNLRKLYKEYSSGYFKVPSVGAGTANTEFEVLTGMSMRFFAAIEGW